MDTCISIVLDSNKILMIYKKRGLGKGLYNFPGGKIKSNEKGEECAIRELKEETGLIGEIAEYVGKITFIIDENHIEEMSIYLIKKFKGNIIETDEAIPMWVNVNEIPYDKMWEDDKEWVPLVLAGYKIKCKFYFSNNWEKFIGGSCKVI